MTRFGHLPYRPRDASPRRPRIDTTTVGRLLRPEDLVDFSSSILILELWDKHFSAREAFVVIDRISDVLAQAAVNRYHWSPQPLVSCGPLLMASRHSGVMPRLVFSDDPESYVRTVFEYDMLRTLPCDVVVPGEWTSFTSCFLTSVRSRFPAWQRIVPEVVEC